MPSQDNQYFLLVQNYFRYLVKYWQQKYDERGKTYWSDSKIQHYCVKNPSQLQNQTQAFLETQFKNFLNWLK